MATDANNELVHDDLCEQTVLGTLMNTTTPIAPVREYLDEDCFYNNHHKDVWKAITTSADKGNTPSLVNVMAELGAMRSPVEFLEVGRICQKSTYENLEQYAMRLRELCMRRQLWVLGQQLIASGTSEVTDIANIRTATSNTLDGIFCKAASSVRTLGDVIPEVFEIMRKNISKQTEITGSHTGFREIDRKGGFQPSDFIVIAGDSSNGKTSIAINMAFNVSQSGDRVAIYSLEMLSTQLAARILSSMSGIPASSILYNGNLSSEDFNRVDDAVNRINGTNLYFDDSSTSSLDSIINSIRAMKAKYGISGAVIDYLQILSVNGAKGKNEEQIMAEAARKLKNLAKDIQIWIVALSQLSRDKENPRPTRNRLRSSGQIFEAADIVLAVYRPEIYGKPMPEPFEGIDTANKAFVEALKGRNTGLFSFVANFNPMTTTFTDYDGTSIPQSPNMKADAHPDYIKPDLPF